MLNPFAIGSLSGATLLTFLPSLPSNNQFAAIALCGLLLSLGGFLSTNKTLVKTLFVLLLGGLIGFSWAFLQASSRLSWHFPFSDLQKEIEISAKVDGITQANSQGLRFDAVLLSYRGQKLKQNNVKVRLYWANPHLKLMHGDFIHGWVKCKPPWHLANPGSFDQEKQYFIEGIRATGKVVRIDSHLPSQGLSFMRFRQALCEKMETIVGEKPLLGVIQAMTLGISSGITPGQWQTFQNTGTSHLVAISGQQVALVATLCFFLVTALVRRFPMLTSLYPDKYYGAIAAMGGALVYSGLAGFSIPTQRALMMIVIGMVALLRGQPVFTWHRLAYAWLGVGLIDPLAPMQLGFWLSFGCVAALIYGRTHYRGKWRQWFFPQWIVFIFLLPFSLVFFHQTALYSPLANMIAVPLISFIVVPISFLGVALLPLSQGFANFSLHLAHISLNMGWIILEKISQLPFNLVQLGKMSWPTLLVASIGVLLLLAPKGVPVRHLGWLGLFPIFFHSGDKVRYGDCHFTLLDVGQGLAAVIQTQHHTLLYDAGPQYGLTTNAGQRVIKPFLQTKNITSFDKVIISHSDLDHRGGLPGLADFPMGEVLTAEPDRLRVPAGQCIAGQAWEWDGVNFKILGPITVNTKKRNDLSCVLKVSTATKSILLSGDIEKTGEEKLIAYWGEELKSHILVVPHHGSKTSSTEEFVQKVAPQYALYPVGIANHYGFPRNEVVDRYEKRGTVNLVSWETGAITFDVPATGALEAPRCWRAVSQRFWFGYLKEGERFSSTLSGSFDAC